MASTHEHERTTGDWALSAPISVMPPAGGFGPPPSAGLRRHAGLDAPEATARRGNADCRTAALAWPESGAHHDPQVSPAAILGWCALGMGGWATIFWIGWLAHAVIR